MKVRLLGMGIVLLIFLCTFASATNVGVSPANINFKNVLRGGYAERPIIVTIDTLNSTDATITSRGEISSWLQFSQTNFSVSKDKAFQLMLSVTPPTDIPNGNYTGFVTVKSSKLASSKEGYVTGIVIPVLDVFIKVQVTDQELIACRASNFKVTSVEQGDDIIFELDVLNEGNIRLSPKITFDIWDQSSTVIVKQFEFSDTEIAPTQKDRLLIKIPSSGMELGQYWVDISAVDCYNSQTLTFDILEEGALRAAGVLEKITVSPWADIDEIVPIFASFKNTGEKPLDAKFKGQITFKNKIIQLLESDEELYVPIDNSSNFQFYFTPKDAGKYIISGKVFYDNKRTYEQSAVLNVKPEQNIFKSIIKTGTYAILILVIITLLFKIRKERKYHFRKIRRSLK
ncbi:hypothetical protein KAI32_04395 [Candidatus Pacearchaeota archaeon]|nr:hypothetical protein [Candidatus Pacearchaeota archaeon]